jgi:hypothetical protein
MRMIPLGRPELGDGVDKYTCHCRCPYISRELHLPGQPQVSASVSKEKDVHFQAQPQFYVTLLKEEVEGTVRLVDCEELYMDDKEDKGFEYKCNLIPGWHHSNACPLVSSEDFLRKYESGKLSGPKSMNTGPAV